MQLKSPEVDFSFFRHGRVQVLKQHGGSLPLSISWLGFPLSRLSCSFYEVATMTNHSFGLVATLFSHPAKRLSLSQ